MFFNGALLYCLFAFLVSMLTAYVDETSESFSLS